MALQSKCCIIMVMDNRNPYVRLITASVKKLPTPIKECEKCKGAMKQHVHIEELERPHEKVYWFIKKAKKPFYEKVLKEQMKKIWSNAGLEPIEIVFKDRENDFAAVAMCYQKGDINNPKVKELKAPSKLSKKKLKKLVEGIINQWDFNPVEAKTNTEG